MVDFRCQEYAEGMVLAGEETIQRIIATGIRRTAFGAKVDTKTIMTITRREDVKVVTLAKVESFLDRQKKEHPS